VLVTQSTNVLVDLLIEPLLAHFGQLAASHIVLSILTCTFFLGGVLWLQALSNGQSWRVWPILLMLTHGIILQSGFLNFYLSTAICLFALGLLWRPTIPRVTIAVVLFVIARFAHPLPILWAISVLLYVRLASRVEQKARIWMIAAAGITLVAVRSIIMWKFAGSWKAPRVLEVTGASQILLHPTSFALLALVLLVLGVAAVLRSRNLRGVVHDPIFHVYVVSMIAVVLMPENVNAGQFSSGGYISLRFSLFAALAGVAVLARHARSAWFFKAGGVIAILFFALLFRDAKAASKITHQLENETAALAGMPRVTSQIRFPQFRMESELAKPLHLPGIRAIQRMLYDEHFGINIAHVVDAACIDHCISYGNYEPSTYQFRVRALPGNHFAATTGAVAGEIQAGHYVVQAGDLPMYSIYVCGPAESDLCTRALRVGETNGYPSK
jgi:hypothetical protein